MDLDIFREEASGLLKGLENLMLGSLTRDEFMGEAKKRAWWNDAGTMPSFNDAKSALGIDFLTEIALPKESSLFTSEY
jgi:hypothetical protein